jgi:hypothetical protein
MDTIRTSQEIENDLRQPAELPCRLARRFRNSESRP